VKLAYQANHPFLPNVPA
jgi:hypothetical protein